VRPHTITVFISVILSTAVASSFFILPTSSTTLIHQPFYLLFGFSVILAIIQYIQSSEWRQAALSVIRRYLPFIITFAAGAIANLFFFATLHSGSFNVAFLGDLLRTGSLILFFILILIQGRVAPASLRFIMAAFFLPLCLGSLLFIRELSLIAHDSPIPFLAAYKLQGFQSDNPTALGTWLVITFAFCIAPLLLQRNGLTQKILLSLLATTSLALIWWTNSRGAIIGSLLGLFFVAALAYIKRQKLLRELAFLVPLIIFGSLLILPQQALNSVFVRLYPEYYQRAIDSNFKIAASTLTRAALDSTPAITSAQNRGSLWTDCPRYVVTHPFGEYGPDWGTSPSRCGQHNSLFQASVWGGWLTLGATLWLLWQVIACIIRLFRRDSTDMYTIALSVALFGVLLQSFLNSFLQFKPLWIIMALTLAYQHEKLSTTPPPSRYTAESSGNQ
jgi:hypothetical protein